MGKCPECGSTVSEEQSFCVECGEDLSSEGVSAADECGDFVTEKQIGKVEDVLNGRETIHYIVKGSQIKIETRNGSETKGGMKGWERGVFTDEHIILKVPAWSGTYTETIPYDEVTGIEAKKGLINKRVSVERGDKVYHIKSIDSPDIGECEDAVQFARKMASNEKSKSDSEEDVARESITNGGKEEDTTEKLKKLKELRDEGVITKEEFESKKQELLDEL